MSRLLWLDSTVARDPERLKRLCRLARSTGWTPHVHPQVHLEQARGVAVWCRAHGRVFSAETLRSFLAQHGIEAPSFALDLETAKRWGTRLAERYPTDPDWQEAKRRSLGAHGGRRVPMTCDWWIALVAEDDPDAVVVTDDRGVEWAVLATEGRAWTTEEALSKLGASGR